MTKRTHAVLVLIETDDPRLAPDVLSVATVADTVALREAVVDNLPSLLHVLAIMPPIEADAMLHNHEMIQRLSGDSAFERPPNAYMGERGKLH